jgi:hypothetical protein
MATKQSVWGGWSGVATGVRRSRVSPRTQGPKNYSRPRVHTSYFYFYVRFRATTAVVDGRGIFGIWRVGEEIWVRTGGGDQRVKESEWKMRRTGGGLTG